MAKYSNMAWAIDTRSREGHGFLGRYYPPPHIVPIHLAGCHIAVWNTRRAVRQELARMRASAFKAFPNAQAIRVRVTIEEVKANGTNKEQ